jgi:hypothetical protein
VYIDNISLSRSDPVVEPSCSSWNFEDGSLAGWMGGENVMLETSSPGYGGSGKALRFHHAFANDPYTAVSMMVQLCPGGLSSITGITMQARFVPDPGYGDFPGVTGNRVILMDGQEEVQESYTPFGAGSQWTVVSNSFSAVSGSYLKIYLGAMGNWQGTVYIDNLSLSRSDPVVQPSCSSWNFEDGSLAGWMGGENVMLETSSPGYGGSGKALRFHHAFANDPYTAVSMMVQLCPGGLSSITGITMQARFVPDPGYGDFPGVTGNRVILMDGQEEVQESYTPFGAGSQWTAVSSSFSAVSGSYLKIYLGAMGNWQGTVYIDNLSLQHG